MNITYMYTIDSIAHQGLSPWTKQLALNFHEQSVEHSIQNQMIVCTMFADALAHDIARPSAII